MGFWTGALFDLRQKEFSEDDRAVLLYIPGREHKRHPLSSAQLPQLIHRRTIFDQFRAVAPAKLFPSFSTMPEPGSQLRCRGNVFHPMIDLSISLGQPPWPQSLDKNAQAIIVRQDLVGSFQFDL